MPIKRAKNKLDAFQHWFFEVGTRLVELFSAAILLSFSLKMIFRHVEIITLYPYRYFKHTEPLIFIGIALFASLQIMVACKKTLRSNFGSGVLLLWAGFIYSWLTVNFALDRPPSIEAVTSAIMAVTCFLAGREVLSLNRRVDSKNKAG
ncbi:hypothetical protein [Pseudoalteromonas phage vB_PalP_Y7]|nr:hypothetical protein [Pseudoalteromonas phage vB_PalP_Y7]